jgi:hypothetical protein
MIHERRTEDKTGEKDIEEQGEKGSTFSFIQDPTQSRREKGEKKRREKREKRHKRKGRLLIAQ